MDITNYVNQCTNVAWLSGYAARQADGTVLVRQSANDAMMIPVHVPATLNLPPPDQVTELKCHVFGRRDPDTGRSEVRLEAFLAKRASIQAAPRTRTTLNNLRERMKVIESPFAPREQILAEIEQRLQIDRTAIEAILLNAEKRGRDTYTNRVLLSGFVGYKAFVPPADDGSGDLGYVLFNVMQHDDPSRGVPVRVRGADARFGKDLGHLKPVAVVGKVGVEVDRDEAGTITARRLFIETDRHSVGMAMITDFLSKEWPVWWRQAVMAYHNELRQRREADQARAAKIAANPVAQAQANDLSAGVQVQW